MLAISECIKSSSGRVIAVLAAVIMIGGYLRIKESLRPPVNVTSVKTEVAKKTTSIITHKQRTVKKPDGTVITDVTITQEKVKAIEDITDKISVINAASKPKYSLGINYLPSITQVPSFRDTEITAGARLGDSNVWLKSGFDLKYRQVKIGLELQF